MRSRELSSAYGFRLLSQPRFQVAIVGTVLAIVLAFRIVLFLNYSTQSLWGYDFSAYWAAGRHVLEGEPIYAPFQAAGSYPPQQHQLYLYPPFLAVAVTPLSALFDDYHVANWLWAAAGALIVTLVVIGVTRREGMDRRRTALLLLATFAFAPVVGELLIGNVHLIVLGLLAATWVALRDGTPRGELAAGVLIGVAALIKVFPGLLILWFLLTGRLRAAAAAIATMALLAAATIPVVGLQVWLDYPVVLLNQGPLIDTSDLLAPAVWLSELMPSFAARLIVLLAGLGVIVWSARRRSDPISFAVTVAVALLVTPAVYQHYLAILVLPLLLAIRYAPPLAWVVVAYVLMSGGEQAALGNWVWIVNRVLPTLGALLVVAGLIWFGRGASEPALSPVRTSP